MLKILDKYIIRKFLSTFFFMLGIIMLFAMVFDVSEKLSEFISNKAPVSAIIFEYYVSILLYHGNMFSSMIVFISVIWFTAKMAQDTEIIPMWFSGKPITRFLRPYMISATVLMVLSLLLNHFIVPTANKLRLGFEEKYYRDVMMVQSGNTDSMINTDMCEQIESYAAAHPSHSTILKINAIMDARTNLAHNAAPLVTCEALMCQLARK
jgi:lipopolysaccharide export system permease protein